MSFYSICIVMPNRTGNTKRKKRNEKSKKAELLHSGVTSVNVPCTSSTEASATSGGGEMSETKDGSAGYIKQIIIITIIGIIIIYRVLFYIIFDKCGHGGPYKTI